MNIFLHICCGPCAIYPIKRLMLLGANVKAYFYNPNIHGIQEFYKRLDASVAVCEHFNIDYELDKNYGLSEFLKINERRENLRCHFCYAMRIDKTAQLAKEQGYEYFTTSLLYSKRQQHEAIKYACEKAAEKYEIKFYYEDFREGWKDGIETSKQLEIYRQNYCGCIFSEEERFKRKNF